MRRPKRNTPISSLVGLVATLALAIPCAVLIVNRAVSKEPDHPIELLSATGTISILNSLEGKAVLSAAPMVPGQQSTGTVTLGNTGGGSERMTLGASAPVDTPGPAGGRLSSRLRLVVTDTTSADGRTVYDGPIDGLGQQDLGDWKADEQRTYRFTVAFMDGGAGGADNAYQGSAASVNFAWTAAEGSGGGGSAPPSTYAEAIVDSEPISWWRMADLGTGIADAIGGHNGELKNAPAGAVDQDGALYDDKAIRFDGKATYAYVNGIAAPKTAYTMEAWVKPVAVTDGTIVEQGGAGALALKGGHFAFRQVDTVIAAPDTARAGRWYHVAATWSSADHTAKLYVDGEVVASGASSTAPSGQSSVFIGYGSFAPWFDGYIDEVAYYDTRLATASLAAHHAIGRDQATAPRQTPAETTPAAPPAPAPQQPSGGDFAAPGGGASGGASGGAGAGAGAAPSGGTGGAAAPAPGTTAPAAKPGAASCAPAAKKKPTKKKPAKKAAKKKARSAKAAAKKPAKKASSSCAGTTGTAKKKTTTAKSRSSKSRSSKARGK